MRQVSSAADISQRVDRLYDGDLLIMFLVRAFKGRRTNFGRFAHRYLQFRDVKGKVPCSVAAAGNLLRLLRDLEEYHTGVFPGGP